MPVSIGQKILIRAHIPRPHDTFTRASSQWSKASKGRQVSSRHKQGGVLCRMIKRSSPGKTRDILVACCKRKEGKGIWFIARELMRPYSTVCGWLVRMMRRGLGRRFDQKSTGRKKILGPQTLKKIMEWTRWDPSRYGFEPAPWHLESRSQIISPPEVQLDRKAF